MKNRKPKGIVNEEIPLPIIPSPKGRGVGFFRFGHWVLAFRDYLGFGIWNLGFLFLLLFILFGVGCQRSKAGITVAGSTSVEPFAGLLAEEYMIRHPKSHIYVQGGGSSAGIEAVRSRAADIGMSSRSLMAGEKSLYSVTIARDAIAVIVHPKNSVQGLPLTKVRDVFSGKIRNWRELGGHDHPIILGTRE